MAPLDITPKLLSRWQRTLLNFIWQFKRPRLSQVPLCTSNLREGMAIPNLELYFQTTLLSAFLKRYVGSYNAAWKDIME